MTAFDDPRYLRPSRESLIRTAVDAASSHAAVLMATVAASSILVCLVMLLAVADREVENRLSGLIEDTSISVFVKQELGRADAEAIGVRLAAMSQVSSSTLHPKEEALKTLGLEAVALRDGFNPLPDIWVVRLKRPDPGASVGAAFKVAADAFGMLPGVDSVRFDAGWVEKANGWAMVLDTRGPPLKGGILCAFAVILLCTAFVTGRSLRSTSTSGRSLDKRVLTIFGAITSSIALIVGMAGAEVGVRALPWIGPSGAIPSLMDPSSRATAAIIAAITLGAISIGLALGAIDRVNQSRL